MFQDIFSLYIKIVSILSVDYITVSQNLLVEKLWNYILDFFPQVVQEQSNKALQK